MHSEQLFVDANACSPRLHGQSGEAKQSKGELSRLMGMSAEARLPEAAASTLVARLGPELPGPAWRMVVGSEEFLVHKAASCLLMPCSEDLVQVLVQGDSAWVLAVLERAHIERAMALDFGDASVRVSASQLDFEAGQGITHKANELSSVSMVIREVTQEHCSYVKQARIVQAGSMHVDVDQHLRIHSSLATVMADALLKLDGAQIHMG